MKLGEGKEERGDGRDESCQQTIPSAMISPTVTLSPTPPPTPIPTAAACALAIATPTVVAAATDASVIATTRVYPET